MHGIAELWAGIDADQRTHHLVLIDGTVHVLVLQKVTNEESDLLDLLAKVFDISDGCEVSWATDLTDEGAGLVITLLTTSDQQVLNIPGRIIHHAAATYRGDGKTDTKDARIIAEQARMRTDMPAIMTPQ